MALITLKQLLAHTAEKIYGVDSEIFLSMDNIDSGLLGKNSTDAGTLTDICKTAQHLRCGDILE